jgi:hypothetical protein
MFTIQNSQLIHLNVLTGDTECATISVSRCPNRHWKYMTEEVEYEKAFLRNGSSSADCGLYGRVVRL